MPDFKHRGITIGINGDGNFYTTDSERLPNVLSAKTLDALKHLIDQVPSLTQKPVNLKAFVLSDGYYDDEEGTKLVPVIVTGISTTSYSYRRGPEAWVKYSHGRREKFNAESVYLDTVANRKLANQYIKLEKRQKELRKQAELVQGKLKHVELPPPPPPKKKLALKAKE